MAVVMAVLGVYSLVADLFLRDRSRVNKRVDEQLRQRQRDQAKKSLLFKDLASQAAEAAAELQDRRSLRQRFEAMVQQSGLNLTPRRLLKIMLGAGTALGLFVALVSSRMILAGAFALIGAAIPLVYVEFKRRARLEKMMLQLPDAFDLMARIIRAGQTMSQAMQGVADEFDKPISAEFSYCYEQQNLGLPSEVSMRDLAERTGLLELRIFVLAMLVQQQTGGNLAELLERLATVIRARFRLRGKIKALTAEARLQATLLLVLPALMFFGIMGINPSYAMVLFDYPWLLAGMVVFELLGALWIRKIVNFDF
jgi:tight adherence protein B